MHLLSFCQIGCDLSGPILCRRGLRVEARVEERFVLIDFLPALERRGGGGGSHSGNDQDGVGA